MLHQQIYCTTEERSTICLSLSACECHNKWTEACAVDVVLLWSGGCPEQENKGACWKTPFYLRASNAGIGWNEPRQPPVNMTMKSEYEKREIIDVRWKGMEKGEADIKETCTITRCTYLMVIQVKNNHPYQRTHTSTQPVPIHSRQYLPCRLCCWVGMRSSLLVCGRWFKYRE